MYCEQIHGLSSLFYLKHGQTGFSPAWRLLTCQLDSGCCLGDVELWHKSRAQLCFVFSPILLISAKQTSAQSCCNISVCPQKSSHLFFCVTHLTFKSRLTLWYFTCFAKDETTWDCAASIWIPVCRLLLVKSVRGNYSQSYSYILQSVCSEDFIGLSGRSTKQLDSGNYTT